MEKIDDHTVEISFTEPYGIFIETLARWRPNPYAPMHYLKDFHASYTSKDELDEKVKAEGLDNWPALFQAKKGGSSEFWAMPERPTITAWLAQNSITEPIHVLERNPYYYKVDTEGQQLPYIDRMERTTVTDPETALLKLFAGEADYLSMRPYGCGLVFSRRRLPGARKLSIGPVHMDTRKPWQHRLQHVAQGSHPEGALQRQAVPHRAVASDQPRGDQRRSVSGLGRGFQCQPDGGPPIPWREPVQEASRVQPR